MSTTETPGHLPIGEVLTLLREEFPDVTISKIRFLESQGLIQPERTPSGYRKFYEADIARLRWVLRQQKERFLPLKVIKERLDSGAPLDDLDESPAQATLFSGREPAAQPSAEPPPRDHAPAAATPAPPAAEAPPEAPGDTTDPGAWLAALQESPRRRPPSRPVERPAALLDADDETVHYSSTELAEAAGIDESQLDELVGFGIVRAAVIGGASSFDETALRTVRASAVFLGQGIEARHLRAYLRAVEREVGMFEQLILPLLRQRNPEARAQAAEQLATLGDAGAALRAALLRQELRASLLGR